MAAAHVSLTSAIDFCSVLGTSTTFNPGTGKLQLRVATASGSQMVAALFQLASEIDGATHRAEGATVFFQFPPDSPTLARLVCTLVPFATTALQATKSRKRRKPTEDGDLGPLLAYHGVSESVHDDRPYYEYASTSSAVPEMFKLHGIFKALRFRYQGSSRTWMRNTRLGRVPQDEDLIIALRELMARQVSISKLSPDQPCPVLATAGLAMDGRGVLTLAALDGEQPNGIPASQESPARAHTPGADGAAAAAAASAALPPSSARSAAADIMAAAAAARGPMSPGSSSSRGGTAATPRRGMAASRRRIKAQRTTSL